MSIVPSWYDRQFAFLFPAEQFPSVFARLRGTPARLEELLRDVAPGVRVRKPQGEDKWSAQEHAGHLLDLESLWLRRVEDFVAGGNVLTVADLSNRKTHEARHNERPLGDILAQFQGARRQLMARVETINAELFSRSMIHPRLKQPMRLVDHLFFVAEHDDHHLAWIWALIHESQ